MNFGGVLPISFILQQDLRPVGKNHSRQEVPKDQHVGVEVNYVDAWQSRFQEPKVKYE